MSDLIFSHIRKVFGDGVVAVEDFNLTVPSPRMVVLVGPSGSTCTARFTRCATSTPAR